MANIHHIKNNPINTITTITTNNTGAISISPIHSPIHSPQPHVFGPASNPNHWGGGNMLNNNWPIMPSAQSLGLSPSLLIALISFDEVLPETRYFLMKYINMIETSVLFSVTAKTGNPLTIDPEISKFFLESTGSVPNLNEVAINDLVNKGYVEGNLDKVLFTQSGIDLLQGFIQFDKL